MRAQRRARRTHLGIKLGTVIILSVATRAARADTVVWTNTGSSVWGAVTNWSPHAPGPADIAIITNNGIVTLDSNRAVGSVILGTVTNCGSGSLFMNGQTLTYSGQFLVNPCGTLVFNNGGQLFGIGSATLAGLYSWSGGPFPFGGVIAFATNSTLNIVSPSDHDMPGVVVTNYGTVAWSGGRVRGGGTPGTFIYNYGLWDSEGDLLFNSDFQQQGLTFNNLGTFLKSAGTNTGTIFSPNNSLAILNNSGVVDIESGWVTLNDGALLSGGSVTGSGILYLNAGAFTLNGTVTTTTNVQFTGGAFVGANRITGGLTWAGGNWNSAPSVTLAANSELDIVSVADHDLASCVFTNLGKVEWLAGRLRGGSTPGTVIYNQGVWEVQCDQAVNSDYQQDGVVFNNLGTLRKINSTGSTVFSPNNSAATFNNAGLVDVKSGSVVLNGGGVLSGGSVTGSGIFYLNAGTFTINGTVTTLNVQFTGGSFVGVNSITNGLTWVSGNWDGATAVLLAPNSELDIVSGNDHDLFSCVFVNQGTVEWFAGRIRGGGTPGTTIYNMGLWEAQCDQVVNSDGQQAGLIFNNQGTFRKSVTTGSTTFSPNASAATFNNSGLVDLDSGALVLNAGGTLSGGMITGTGIWYLNGGNFTLNGMYTTTTNVQFTAGAFAGANTILGGLTWAAGTWNDASSVSVTSNSELDIVSGVDHDLVNCLLTNRGKVEWLGGRLRGGGTPGTVVYNLNLWEAQCDQTFNSDGQQRGVIFNNIGTFRKLATTGSTTFQPNNSAAAFNNMGLVDVQTGAIVLNSGGLFSGGSVIGSGIVELNSGGFTINGTVTTTNVQLSGGVLAGANVLSGGFTWASGNWNNGGPVTLASGSELDIICGTDHDMASCVFTNQGRVKWLGGRVRGGSTPGTVIHNLGLWDTFCDSAINSDYQQYGLVFNNYNVGTFRKSVTTGATAFNPNNAQATFNNLGGTIQLETGTFYLPQQNFSQNGGTLTIGLTGYTSGLWGELVVASPYRATLNGPLNVILPSGPIYAVQDQFQIVSCAGSLLAGQFSPVSLPPNLTVYYTTSGAFLWATNGPTRLISMPATDGQFQFGFFTAAGHSYTVQQNTNVNTANWVYYTNFTGNGSLITMVEPGTTPPQRYFRVREP
jgi:hypothetical protein